jgi:ATP-dependent Clp protease, protease subunit
MIVIDGLKPNKIRNYSNRSVIDGVFAVKDEEIQLYDEIGFWGVTAKAFTKELSAMKGKNITLAINSPGGDVFDGIAMYNALKAHDGQVNVRIDGLAASAASIVAMAGDTIEMADNAFLMIHNAWSVAIGNKHDMRSMGDVLDKVDAALNETYRKKTQKPKDEIESLMDDETWLDAKESLELGFIDGIVSNEDDVSACFDVSIFKNTPFTLKRSIENNLRDKGYSKTLAKAAVSDGFEILAGRDALECTENRRDADSGALAGELNNLAAFIKNIA